MSCQHNRAFAVAQGDVIAPVMVRLTRIGHFSRDRLICFGSRERSPSML